MRVGSWTPCSSMPPQRRPNNGGTHQFEHASCGYNSMVVGETGGMVRGVIETVACRSHEKLYEALVPNRRGPISEP